MQAIKEKITDIIVLTGAPVSKVKHVVFMFKITNCDQIAVYSTLVVWTVFRHYFFNNVSKILK